ncbi:MAG: AmmeMemoRadiSam system protein A [Phycisphaerales bacterium]|nr:AmmeMemoRadiSam system protein A [Phycisphaerales bacterium]
MMPPVPDTPATVPPSDWAAYARAILTRIAHGQRAEDIPAPLPHDPHHGVFVTLHKGSRLRGCMGVLDPNLPLATAIQRATVTAATHDPRFPPLQPHELADLRITVSVLNPPEPVHTLAEITPGLHGVLICSGPQRGLFLPQVATELGWDAEELLSRCCTEKAGLAADAWRRPDVQVQRFTTRVYEE